MIDFSKFGSNGVIIQYEDVISLYGFNVLYHFMKNNACDALRGKSSMDLMLSYLNREEESIVDWIRNESGLTIDPYMNSPIMWKPSLLYAYRIFDVAYKSGIKQLMIHSNKYVKAIENHIQSFPQSVTYIHGDIVPVLKQYPNVTYITSSPSNIRKCLTSGVPFVLTIIDEFGYVGNIIREGVDKQLRDKNILVFYTGILSGGSIDIRLE